tara:strand:- start:868 stop:2109 length:1242 start_codon:yes stop_codon:yes gene_type:complete
MIDQREFFFSKKDLIERDIVLDKYIKTKQIVLISGIRRCGKSSLLYLIKKKIKTIENNILYFNFDDERLNGFTSLDFNKIFELHLELFNSKIEEIIMFVDEIQNMDGWEKFLNRMYERGIKIFATGSNAKLLSSEIATSLTGRNMIISLYPFSFKEFLKFNGIDYDHKLISTQKRSKIISTFHDFLKYGGFPLVAKEKDLEIVKNYYQDIIYRDIIARFNISQLEEIKTLGNYLATNIGKIISYSTLKEISKIKSLSTLKNYLTYFENSYLFYFIKKFDYSVKKQVLNPRKIFISDVSFNYEIGFKFSDDRGRILENIVFVELLRRGKEIFYHKNKKECDFIVKEKQAVKEAIQVSLSLKDPLTKKREIAGLLEAMKSYKLKKGLILIGNEEGEESIENKRILKKPIWKWLLE